METVWAPEGRAQPAGGEFGFCGLICRILPHIPLTLYLFIHFCFGAESHQVVQAVLKLVIRLPQTSRSFVLICIFFKKIVKYITQSEIAKGYGMWLSGRGLS